MQQTQFMLLCEYTLRKYMYFRLLSFGIMVQYEKRKLWRSWCVQGDRK